MQQPQVAQQSLGLGQVPGLAGLLQSVDPTTLQKLLLTLQQGQAPPQPQQPTYQQQPQISDLASMLARQQQPQYGNTAPQPQQQQPYGTPNTQASALGAFGGTAGLAALLGQAQQKVAAAANNQPPPPPQQQNTQQTQQQQQSSRIGNIMETLAKWKQA
jgi:nuclear polyadenylated RNA-binding protein 3